ncbi:MAG: T9SS type A sorting domain-containing protein [Bacteroidota bacterium]
MRKILTLFVFISAVYSAEAQVGAVAPDFTITDIYGEEHNLYSILDDGKVVVLDCSATWCNPCWAFHEAHFLNDLNAAYGPDGTDQIRVIFYEADAQTTSEDLNGTGSNTYGDWVTGTTYPIVDENPVSLSGSIFWPLGFPTINVINPETKVIDADLWDPWSQNQGNDEAALDAMIAIVESNFPTSVSVDEIDAFDASIFPNPAVDEINLTFTAETSGQVQFEVFSLVGQQIYAEVISTVNGSNSIQIPVNEFASGQYLIRLNDGLNTSQITFQVR